MKLAAAIFIALCLPASAATYYVATNGNDAASGTSAGAPWQHVQHGLTNIAAGDTLLLTSDHVFAETGLWCDKKGSPSSPILLSTTTANRAVIASTNGCGFYLTNCSWLTINNLEIIGNPTNRADVDETPVATNTAGVLYIVGNISGSTNFTVQNCAIHLFGVGVHLWAQNTSTNVNALITSNFIYDCTYVGCIVKQNQAAGFITNPIVSYNTISNITGDAGGGGGIFFSRVYAPTAQGNTITKVQNSATFPSVGIEMDFCANGIVRGNEISEVRRIPPITTDATGIDFDMVTHHDLAEFNYIHDCDGAGLVAYLGKTNITFRFNVVVNCGANSAAIGAIYIANPAATDVGVDIYNNTLISLSNDVPGIVLGQQTQMLSNPTNIWANNIIITTNAPAIYAYATTVTNIGLVNNDYYDLGAAPSFVWNGTTYSTWGAFTNAYKQDLGGWTNNPALNSVGILTNNNALTIHNITNYRPTWGSPIRGQGLNLASVFGFAMPSTDFAGAALPASGYSVGACNDGWPTAMIRALTVNQLRFQ